MICEILTTQSQIIFSDKVSIPTGVKRSGLKHGGTHATMLRSLDHSTLQLETSENSVPNGLFHSLIITFLVRQESHTTSDCTNDFNTAVLDIASSPKE